jgi:arsenite transporter
MRFVGHVLSFLGRAGPTLLVVALGAAAPLIARGAHDVLPISAFLLTLGSFLAAALAAPEKILKRLQLPLTLVWIAIGVPATIALLMPALHVEPGLKTGVMPSVVAPPVESAAAIATMLGLRPRLALIASISLTVAAPVLMPLLAQSFGVEVSLDPEKLAERLPQPAARDQGSVRPARASSGSGKTGHICKRREVTCSAW